MTHGYARVPEIDSFPIACREAVFLGARLGHEGNRDAVASFLQMHRLESRSGDIFALYTWVADQAGLVREMADRYVSDSLRQEVSDSLPEESRGFEAQGRRPASLLLAGLSFGGLYQESRSVPSEGEVISAPHAPYPVNRARPPFRILSSACTDRVPVLSRRTIFAGFYRARV
ncbi:MAG: hypothetical protein AABX53_01835 [Nanoarchaeota archaeon]